MAAVRWDAAQEIDEQLHGSRVGARVQVSMTLPASSLGDVIAGGSENNGFGISRISVTGRPAFWRESMNEVNASPELPLPGYVSSCSSGNSSKGSSPSSNRRQRETSPTSPSLTRRVFTLLNDLRRLRHSIRSTSLCSSVD